MKNKEGVVSRRKIIGWLTVLTVAASSGLTFFKPKRETKKIKMLAQDGTLVEIDESLISKTGNTLTNKELQEWVSKKK